MAISGRISGQDVVLEKQRGPDSSFEASRGSSLQSLCIYSLSLPIRQSKSTWKTEQSPRQLPDTEIPPLPSSVLTNLIFEVLLVMQRGALSRRDMMRKRPSTITRYDNTFDSTDKKRQAVTVHACMISYLWGSSVRITLPSLCGRKRGETPPPRARGCFGRARPAPDLR